MPWSIELYADETSAHSIRSAARQQVVTPHVSLAVAESVNQVPLEHFLYEWANRLPFIPVTFDHWGLFLAESAVLFLAPRDRARLDTIHQEFHRNAGQCLADEWEYYKPQQWVPHCTMVDHMALADLGMVAEQARQLSLPLTISLNRMALVEFGRRRVEHWVGPLKG